MKKHFTVLLFSILFSTVIYTQGHNWFYEIHERYKEASLYDRFFTHSDIKPLIENIALHPDFEVNKEGYSVEGREIYLVKWGQGPKTIFMWTQMHGDEPTATKAVFDIMNFLKSGDHMEFKEELAEQVTLLFLPFLNPDGAEVFKRRNALEVDLNRDAQRLQSPEAQILKDVRDRYNPDFGFNLHDQSLYYGAGHSGVPVALAFLAPAYNQEREVNEVRLWAMKLTAQLNEIVQEYLPGKVAKFGDAYEPRAFGDNMQAWGTSTILIEAGGLLDDPEKQYLRKLHFVMLMSAFVSIADKEYLNYTRDAYEAIPPNRISIFDLLVEGGTVEFGEQEFILDLGFRNTGVFLGDQHGHPEVQSRLVDIGDLSTFGYYRHFDASGYKIRHASVYQQVFRNLDHLLEQDWITLVQSGYGYFRLRELPDKEIRNSLPFLLLHADQLSPEFPRIGRDAALLLLKSDDSIDKIIANGRINVLEDFINGTH
jgi:hypothetical protein